MGVLVGNPQRVFVVGAAVGANRSARLHGIGHQPVVDQIQLGHMGGIGKCGVHLCLVTDGPFVTVVVGCGIVQGGGAARIAHIDDSRQNIVLNGHEFGCVFGLFQGFGDHHDHMVTHIAHFVVGQDGVGRFFHGLTIGIGDQPAARQAIDFRVDHVLAVQYPNHTRCSKGGFFINTFDLCVCVR